MAQAFIKVGRKDRAHIRARPHPRYDNELEVQVLDSNEILRAVTRVSVVGGDYQVGDITLYSLNPNSTRFDDRWAWRVIFRTLSESRAERICYQ